MKGRVGGNRLVILCIRIKKFNLKIYRMRLLKNHPFLKLVNAYIIDHSQPTNISYL